MPSLSSLLSNTVVRIALAIVGLILVGSVAYYLIESAPPKVTYAAVTQGNISADVTGTGTVSPVQNPILSFEIGGQVTSVQAITGQKVASGALLASLDTSVLAANLEAEQAKLNELEAGPRSVDIAGQQTGVQNAQQALNDTLGNYPQTLESTFAQAQQAISTEADPLFDLSNPSSPSLNYTPLNYTLKTQADADRAQLAQSMNDWQKQLSAIGANPSTEELQSVTTTGINNLQLAQTFLDDLVTALNNVPQGAASEQTSVTTALAQVATARNTIDGLITSLTAADQSITSQQLALQSAQDQLNQTVAGATPQDIQAQQAQVAAIEAQIRQQEIIAPFAGTIASVSIKPGDTVAAASPAISLIPQGNFEVDIYLAENDMTQVKVGNPVDVTLDAYGTGRVFPATVSSIDTSPSTEPNSNNVQGYKVTLVFNSADPAIANGMSANATIHADSAQNVLLIPKSAIITNGTQTFVLKETASGLVQTPVTIGIESSDMAQVVSGLSAGDRISAIGSQQ